MKHIQPVILTAIIENGKILLTKRHEHDPEDHSFHDYWQIPGGGMEFAEAPEDTAIREAREEVGIDIEILRLVPHLYTRVRNDWQGLLIAYVCKRKYAKQEIVINEEASEFMWATLDEAKELDLTPFTELIIEQAFK